MEQLTVNILGIWAQGEEILLPKSVVCERTGVKTVAHTGALLLCRRELWTVSSESWRLSGFLPGFAAVTAFVALETWPAGLWWGRHSLSFRVRHLLFAVPAS